MAFCTALVTSAFGDSGQGHGNPSNQDQTSSWVKTLLGFNFGSALSLGFHRARDALCLRMLCRLGLADVLRCCRLGSAVRVMASARRCFAVLALADALLSCFSSWWMLCYHGFISPACSLLLFVFLCRSSWLGCGKGLSPFHVFFLLYLLF